MASKGHCLLSITNPTYAENTCLILAGYLERLLEGCCFTHLDIYFPEGEFNGPFMWGVVGTAHPWHNKSCEGWGFARCCSPFLWNNHQHPWAGSTPFPPKFCKANPCSWRVNRIESVSLCFGSSTTYKFCAIISSQKIKTRRQNVIWSFWSIFMSGLQVPLERDNPSCWISGSKPSTISVSF